MASSPEAGLNISAIVVTGVESVVEGAMAFALVESGDTDDTDDPPHAVKNKRTTGSKRFNMMQ
jgi:hypothetical protein